jgi:hypothetical protein
MPIRLDGKEPLPASVARASSLPRGRWPGIDAHPAMGGRGSVSCRAPRWGAGSGRPADTSQVAGAPAGSQVTAAIGSRPPRRASTRAACRRTGRCPACRRCAHRYRQLAVDVVPVPSRFSLWRVWPSPSATTDTPGGTAPARDWITRFQSPIGNGERLMPAGAKAPPPPPFLG